MTTKIAFSIEYDFQSSPQLLFQYLSTPSGLSEWFADNENSRGEDYTFIWDDTEEYAKLIQKKNNEKVRFLFPSQLAFGYRGDQNKVGMNTPLEYIIEVEKIDRK